MKWLYSVLFSFSVLTASAQTNSPSANSLQASQIAAVRKAMPGYFTINLDANNVKTITQTTDELLSQTEFDKLELSISASTFPPEKIPYNVAIDLIAHSLSGYTIETNPVCEIHFDDHSITINSLEDGHSFDDGHTLNIYSLDLTLDQFKEVAWAKTVSIKMEDKNYEIPIASRQKWKLMWNYFNLLKSDHQKI